METTDKTEVVQPVAETGLKKFDSEIKKEDLQKLVEETKDLIIKDVNDKEGYAKVSGGRKTLKARRVFIGKVAEGLIEEANQYKNKVWEKEAELIGEIEPTEKLLQERADAYLKERGRIAKEKEDALKAVIDDRIAQLKAVNFEIDYPLVSSMSGEAFETYLEKATEDFEAEKKRLAEIEAQKELERKAEFERQEKIRAEQKAESERLEKTKAEQEEKEKAFRAEQEKIAKEQKEREDKIKAEQEKIEAEKRKIEDEKVKAEQEKIRTVELEKAKKESAEKAVKDAEEKRRVETEAAYKKEQEDIKEQERKEALRPDKEKILSFVSDFQITPPNCEDENSITLIENFKTDILVSLHELKTKAENL